MGHIVSFMPSPDSPTVYIEYEYRMPRLLDQWTRSLGSWFLSSVLEDASRAGDFPAPTLALCSSPISERISYPLAAKPVPRRLPVPEYTVFAVLQSSGDGSYRDLETRPFGPLAMSFGVRADIRARIGRTPSCQVTELSVSISCHGRPPSV